MPITLFPLEIKAPLQPYTPSQVIAILPLMFPIMFPTPISTHKPVEFFSSNNNLSVGQNKMSFSPLIVKKNTKNS